MTRKAYLDELDRDLSFLSVGERQETIREFSSHIDEAMERNPELSEEELIERLPSPAVFAAEFSPGNTEDSGSGQEPDEAASPEYGGTKARFKRFFRYTGGEPKEWYRQFEGVQRIEIRSVDADIKVMPGSRFSCRISGNWDNDAEPELEMSGSMVRVDIGHTADKAELVLPEELAELVLRTVSGDVHGSLCADVSAVVRSISGDIDLVVQNGNVRADSKSGDIQIKGRIGDAEVTTASGDVTLTGLHGDLKANSASGELHLVYTNAEGDSTISTVSGDVRVELPAGLSPAIRAYSVSGALAVPASSIDRRPGRQSCTRDGGPGTLKISTLSGDINIE